MLAFQEVSLSKLISFPIIINLSFCYDVGMEQKVIVLRGAPASGKSTIAKSFRDFDKKIAWLKVDNFKDFFAEDSSVALDYVNGSAIATLEYLLNNGFSVVMDGVFQNPRVLEQALSLSASKGVPCLVFELHAPLDVLQKRDKERDGVKEGLRPVLGNESIEHLYGVLKDTARKDAVKIDTSQNSVEECKEIILDSFKGWGNEKKFAEGAFCFFVKDKKVLLVLTHYGPEIKKYSGYGGGVDEDESPEEAVVREVREEAEVVVEEADLKKMAVITNITKKIPENTQSTFKLTIFLTEKWKGEPKDLPGMQPKWFDFNKLPFDQMFPENKILFPMVLEGKCVEMDSAFVKKDDGSKPELINRDIREVEKLD